MFKNISKLTFFKAYIFCHVNIANTSLKYTCNAIYHDMKIAIASPLTGTCI